MPITKEEGANTEPRCRIPFPPKTERWVVPMDHQKLTWLQTELSKLFSQLLGEEVELTVAEALQVASALGCTHPEIPGKLVSQFN
tara:strand:- start:33 stop:287 length:255 start_codon:yes stop_codon:yes gene_type:complete